MEQEKVWDKIAKKWDSYKFEPVEEASKFLLNKKGKILDLGCGSGRNFIKNKEVKLYGVDFSSELLKLARENADKMGIDVKLEKSETSNIPYDDNFFDAVIFLRVLHCVDTAEKRKKSLQELFRVLKPNTEAVVSVWGKRQDRIKNKNKVCFVPWTIEDKRYLRYTYLYDKNELVELLRDIGFIVLQIKEHKNIVVIVKKPLS